MFILFSNIILSLFIYMQVQIRNCISIGTVCSAFRFSKPRNPKCIPRCIFSCMNMCTRKKFISNNLEVKKNILKMSLLIHRSHCLCLLNKSKTTALRLIFLVSSSINFSSCLYCKVRVQAVGSCSQENG